MFITLNILVKKLSFFIKKKILVTIKKKLRFIKLPLNSFRRLVFTQGGKASFIKSYLLLYLLFIV